MFIVLLLLLPGVRLEDPTHSTLLSHRNIKQQPYKAVQFFRAKKPLKKGPILFPNDGPPPPPTPLIVTSRPLIESIQRSELNPNNSLLVQTLAQSQINPVTFTPSYLARGREYTPYGFEPNTVTESDEFENVPYTIVNRGPNNLFNEYFVKNDAAQQDILQNFETAKQKALYQTQQRNTKRPIYRGLTSPNVKPYFNYQGKSYPLSNNAYKTYEASNEAKDDNYYTHDKPSKSYQQSNEVEQDTSKDYNFGKNFAFSYAVKDHKTGDDFSHSQQSSGSTTNGEYRVLLPDGRMQIVSYTADENGYKADVRYDETSEANKPDRNIVDLKLIKAKQDDANSHYIEHRVDGIKVDQTPSYIRYLYKDPEKDNIYFDYVDKKQRDDRQDYVFTRPNDYLDDTINHDSKRNQGTYYHDLEDASPSVDYKDYSAENDYLPHTSKYAAFSENNNNGVKSTVKPSYEELKDLFVTKLYQNPASVSSTVTPKYDLDGLNAYFVSSTASPNYDPTTEKVVIIGTKKPNLFTNIKNILSASSISPDVLSYSTNAPPILSTPSSYLYATIKNLKNKISLSNRPQLSSKYIDKINSYIASVK